MKVNFNEISEKQFLEYCNMRMEKGYNNGTLYPYINTNRLKIIYEHMQKKNIICSGNNYKVTVNGKEFSRYSQPDTEKKERMIENILHFVWCEAERICYSLNNRTGSIEAEYTKAFIKQLASA